MSRRARRACRFILGARSQSIAPTSSARRSSSKRIYRSRQAVPTPNSVRLMVAQDTGSAIVGPARADIYWGAGDDAGRIAGGTRQQGRFVILLPRELDMVAAGKAMPLPQTKPPIPHEMVGNQGEGDRPHGNQKDRTKLTEKTQADKAPIRYAQKAADYKKSRHCPGSLPGG